MHEAESIIMPNHVLPYSCQFEHYFSVFLSMKHRNERKNIKNEEKKSIFFHHFFSFINSRKLKQNFFFIRNYTPGHRSFSLFPFICKFINFMVFVCRNFSIFRILLRCDWLDTENSISDTLYTHVFWVIGNINERSVRVFLQTLNDAAWERAMLHRVCSWITSWRLFFSFGIYFSSFIRFRLCAGSRGRCFCGSEYENCTRSHVTQYPRPPPVCSGFGLHNLRIINGQTIYYM